MAATTTGWGSEKKSKYVFSAYLMNRAIVGSRKYIYSYINTSPVLYLIILTLCWHVSDGFKIQVLPSTDGARY